MVAQDALEKADGNLNTLSNLFDSIFWIQFIDSIYWIQFIGFDLLDSIYWIQLIGQCFFFYYFFYALLRSLKPWVIEKP